MKRFAVLLVVAACGGKVVVDQEGAGGQGGTGSGASSSIGPTATTGPGPGSSVTVGTGPGACTSHADCPGGVCVFSTGTCAPGCGDFCSSCGPGLVCNGCATSSCPSCAECVGACLPKTPNGCDDDDPCLTDQACIFSGSVCAPTCSSDTECGSFSFCDPCATGSCCGCDDCVAVCVGGE